MKMFPQENPVARRINKLKRLMESSIKPVGKVTSVDLGNGTTEVFDEGGHTMWVPTELLEAVKKDL